jgi:hypothetical protein
MMLDSFARDVLTRFELYTGMQGILDPDKHIELRNQAKIPAHTGLEPLQAPGQRGTCPTPIG